MPIKLFIIMSLTILLSSGSFFLPDYLAKKLNNKNYSEGELELGLSLKINIAYKEKLNRVEKGSFIWLKYVQELAKSDGETSVALAEYYLESKASHQSEYWYLHAIKLGYQLAKLPLAKLYFDQEQLALSKEVLVSDKRMSDDIFLFAMEVAIAQGDLPFIEKYKAKLSSTESGKVLFEKLVNYKVITDDAQKNGMTLDVRSPNETCPMSLQLFATTLVDLEQITTLKKQFKQLPLSQFICIKTAKYVAMTELSCTHLKTNAIQCDESVWHSIAKDVDSRYIGLLHPSGGANVHLGILYFDRQDSIEVLSHEISHLLGFIDEYALPKNHAVCKARQVEMFSHNIVVLDKLYTGSQREVRTKVLNQIPWAKNIKASTPILSKAAQVTNKTNIKQLGRWRLGTPKLFQDEVGLFTAESCEGDRFRSFKPLSKRTQLLYYETLFPTEYFAFLAQRTDKFLMPSFHYNLAMALIREGNIKSGKKWLIQSANNEDNKNRKLKILQGKF